MKAGVNKVGSHVGNIAVAKIISTVSTKCSKFPKDVVKTIVYKEVESYDEDSSKSLGNIIMKEISKNNCLTSPNKLNAIAKTQYHGYGSNTDFQSKLNKLLN